MPWGEQLWRLTKPAKPEHLKIRSPTKRRLEHLRCLKKRIINADHRKFEEGCALYRRSKYMRCPATTETHMIFNYRSNCVRQKPRDNLRCHQNEPARGWTPFLMTADTQSSLVRRKRPVFSKGRSVSDYESDFLHLAKLTFCNYHCTSCCGGDHCFQISFEHAFNISARFSKHAPVLCMCMLLTFVKLKTLQQNWHS